jgi:hypothetical protein
MVVLRYLESVKINSGEKHLKASELVVIPAKAGIHVVKFYGYPPSRV